MIEHVFTNITRAITTRASITRLPMYIKYLRLDEAKTVVKYINIYLFYVNKHSL